MGFFARGNDWESWNNNNVCRGHAEASILYKWETADYSTRYFASLSLLHRMCPNNLASNVLELEWMVETREKQRDDYSSLSNGPCCILPRMHKDSLFCMQLRCAPCESCSKTCSPSLLCTSCHPTIRSTGGVSILRHTIVRDGRLCGPLLLEVTYLCTYVL